MLVRLCVIGLLIGGLSLGAKAQNTRDVRAPEPPTPQYQAQKKQKLLSVVRNWFNRAGKSERDEFRQRMKQRSRQKRREERLAQKPQYSDPTYFGHKKPPIKRPPGKQKFCKECQMRH